MVRLGGTPVEQYRSTPKKDLPIEMDDQYCWQSNWDEDSDVPCSSSEACSSSEGTDVVAEAEDETPPGLLRNFETNQESEIVVARCGVTNSEKTSFAKLSDKMFQKHIGSSKLTKRRSYFKDRKTSGVFLDSFQQCYPDFSEGRETYRHTLPRSQERREQGRRTHR